MGLDIVELVMAWEETFDISIPDADAERLSTTRDVSGFVFEIVRSDAPEDTGCLAMRAFYRLRSAFVAAGVPRNRVHPDAKVSALLPGRNRRVLVNKIRQDARLPPVGRMPFGLDFTLGRVRDIVLDVVVGRHASLRLPGHGWSLTQVREVVRAVMNVQLALRRFSDDAEFGKDLKLD